MHDTVRAHFAALESALEATPLPDDRKKRIADGIKKIAILYVQLRETNASRYGDEITRRVQSVLVELEACPETRALAPDFHAGLKRLHEELGVPALALKLPKPAPRAKAPRTKAPPRTKATR